jgi:phospholipase/carboxylesterase
MLSRRQLLALSAAAGALRCASREGEADAAFTDERTDEGVDGRLHARIHARPAPPSIPGPRGLQRAGTGMLYVPMTIDPRRPAPLIVALHGAGGHAENAMRLTTVHAERIGAVVVAPKSLGMTWDVIETRLGPDVESLDDALARVFAHYSIDATRVAVSGFSDGASYALTLGVANGDLFTHIVAFSPGFMQPPSQHGAPRIYVSHGTNDQVLPIDRCSRALVPRLQSAGYEVIYREFDGPHTVPPEVAAEAFDWFAG